MQSSVSVSSSLVESVTFLACQGSETGKCDFVLPVFSLPLFLIHRMNIVCEASTLVFHSALDKKKKE